MHIAAILFPDFSLILLGILLYHSTDWGTSFWSGLEKIVYYVLFPALLFLATARTPLNISVNGVLVGLALATTAAGIALGWLAKPLFHDSGSVFSSAVQTAFRFNSYIGFAIASRLGGEQGTALMALVVGFNVPLTNAAAVHALVHKSGGLLKELSHNPLLLATLAGILFNLAGLSVAEPVAALLSRLGSASIALGLIAVGAGLRLSGIRQAKGLSSYFLALKLLALPALAYFGGRWLGLNGLQLQILVAFAALPTASSAYILTTRLGGNGAIVAFLISISTVLSVVTLPFWLGLAH